MKRLRVVGAVGAAAVTAVTLVAPSAPPAVAATQTMTVNVGTVVRSVSHVGAGGLYALASATVPTASQLPPLHLNQLTQPAPGVQQLGNGATTPTGDALKVAPLAAGAGAHEYVRMPDIYPNFPYRWVSWADWTSKVNTMVTAKLNSSAGSTINGWELWNEPDWTWNTASAGSFDAGWVTTYNLVRAKDASTPIVGPSTSVYNHAWMSDFLTYAKAHNALPDVVSWHELTSWTSIPGDVADFKALESTLGISPRPISINEYAATADIDVPSAALHYIANFERSGVTNACRAYWYESGTVNGLLFNNKPTSTYWMYKWYGDMTGNMVQVVAADFEDGIASYNSSTKTLNIIFGGEVGSNAVQINGIAALGAHAKVVMSYTPSDGRQTNVAAPTVISTVTHSIGSANGGSITIPIPNQDYLGAYQLLVTAG
jgi:hypothetical protein